MEIKARKTPKIDWGTMTKEELEILIDALVSREEQLRLHVDKLEQLEKQARVVLDQIYEYHNG